MRHGDLRRERLAAGERIAALAGQGGGHHRQIPTSDGDGALAKIQIEGVFGVIVDDPEVAQQVTDGPVAVTGGTLGAEHRLIDGEAAARPAAPKKLSEQRFRPVRIMAPDLRRGGNRPGIDHRIARTARVLIEADRIEGVAGWFHPHLRGQMIMLKEFERQAIDKRLGDRLNRERFTGVAHLVQPTIDRGDGDPEIGGNSLGKLRDVIGWCPVLKSQG